MGWREIKCRKCRGIVKIPWAWVFGIEMIFYCRNCRSHHKIHYMLGAFLAGVGWALAFASIQLVAYVTTEFTIVLAACLFVPFGILYSFVLRSFALRLLCRR